MKTSERGLNLIKKYEGLRLLAYDDMQPNKKLTDASQVKGTLTIGYGHTGGVRLGQTITQEQADAYLRQDVVIAEKAVDSIGKPFNQNQFDVLVSFTYNCGAGNLRTLCKNRDVDTIGEKLILYTKSYGKELQGLVVRRKEEQELYQTPTGEEPVKSEPAKTSGGNDTIKQGQVHTNNFTGAGIAADGIRGTKTKKAGIMVWQTGLNKDFDAGLKVDGIYGSKTGSVAQGKTVRKGSKGYLVTALEILLMLKGYNPGGVECPGVFGQNLNTAVRCYQKDHGLTVDEIAGIKTFKSLIA